MLKKIAVAALISGFSIASFAQVGAVTSAPAKAATPDVEQKVDAAKTEKVEHKHKHHKHHKHMANKSDNMNSETPAATK